MVDEGGVWAEIATHADRLLQLVADSAPRGFVEISPIQAPVGGMFWRARRLYEGVLLLLRAQLPEEAAILARSLFEEAMRLQQLAAEPENRTALLLGWLKGSISEQQGLLKTAPTCGLDIDIRPKLATLDEQLREVSAYADRHRVMRTRKFQEVRDAAFKFGRKEDFWTYQWAHESVHGSDTVWMYARVAPSERRAVFQGKTGDPGALAIFAQFAAKSMADAAEATFTIFEWTPMPDFQQSVSNIKALIETVRQSLNDC